MITPFPKIEIRCALSASLPEIDQASASPSQIIPATYVPPSHARALDPENTIVEGIRGSGKSFWFATLNSPVHRRYVASVFPETRIDDRVVVSQGFPGDAAPSKDTLSRLSNTYAPQQIWRTIIGGCLQFSSPFPEGSWEQKVAWVTENPETFDDLLAQKDREIQSSGKTHLILFDALDRLADDWPKIRPLARALFQIALDLRACRAIRAKIFTRPDMLEEREILAFPDSSKLLARKVTLAWRRVDLYALLFQCLGNAPGLGGETFRNKSCAASLFCWDKDATSDSWKLPNALRTDENIQKMIFHCVAGPTMASGPSGHKRGFPYTWLPNHLMDGRDQASPRSFIAALKHALLQDSPEEWPYALHYKAIEVGVQEASRIRVDELTREDYPWVLLLLDPLANKIIIPCLPQDIHQVWETAGTIGELRSALQNTQFVKLPPQHLDEGAEGLLKDLEGLGLIQLLRDGRIQMPDVYRIAFKLGRKGGVKPLR